MWIHVNGDRIEVSEQCSIDALLDRLDLGSAACAVEVNRNLVPKRQHESHQLRDDDRVEIVTLVGGG